MTKIIFDASYPGGRDPPDLGGFEHKDGEWRLRLDGYERFIEDVTGVAVDDNISPRELKTIQSRIEGCVATYKRSGGCMCDEFESYEHVDSLETVQELSRFFRVLVATRIEGSLPT